MSGRPSTMPGRPAAGRTRITALATCLLALPLFAGPRHSAHADPVFERLRETGVLRAGTRADAAPFAFRDEAGDLVGLSVDLLERIRAELSRALGRDVRLSLEAVTSSTRIARVESGALDIVCGIATPTWDREMKVDFTIPFFRDGTRILAYRDTVRRVEDMADARIGVVLRSTTERIVTEALPNVQLVGFPDMRAALKAMEAGDVDGVANIGIVLRGLIEETTKRRSLVIVPRSRPLGHEAMACILPENASDWRDFVNGVLRDLFRGIDQYRGDYAAIYERWLGRDGLIVYPLDEAAKRYFSDMLIWAE